MKNIIISLTLFVSFFISLNDVRAQDTIRGRIVDEEGEGLPGVNIVVKGTNKGSISDVNGYFEIEASEGDVLNILSVGNLNQEITVPSENDVNIMMGVGLVKLYWCCTSHEDESQHCNRDKAELVKTHDTDEKFKVKYIR